MNRIKPALVLGTIAIVCLAPTAATAETREQLRLRLGASNAFQYRLALTYQRGTTSPGPIWYLQTHLDGAYLPQGFATLNHGLELGFFTPGLKQLSFGVHLNEPHYTANTLAGISSTLHSRPLDSRLSFFFTAQWLRYLEPIDHIGAPRRPELYNFLTGASLKLSSRP